MSDNSPQGEDTGCFRVTLDIVLRMDDRGPQEIKSLLTEICEKGFSEGSQALYLDVKTRSLNVDVLPAPLSEEEVAAFMQRRIENGDLLAEDVATRLARYGLMERSAFITEMAERMESSALD